MGLIAFIGGIVGAFVLGTFAGILAVLSSEKGESKLDQFLKLFFIVGLPAFIIIFIIILSLYAANFP
ncbi:MAG: hypothetical protein JAZ17_00225 [Candidatus Thiodiazotropha endolucinida]|nr:hypothetical protein [Candidatus Thiodiazotropha taylori]MCG8092051.1 hypothetical protein [Candidatus Thiodiazotropha endolucinida]MCW4315624.1 hypothetical protein [Candidatus Thiodiazotropha taylori]